MIAAGPRWNAGDRKNDPAQAERVDAWTKQVAEIAPELTHVFQVELDEDGRMWITMRYSEGPRRTIETVERNDLPEFPWRVPSPFR